VATALARLGARLWGRWRREGAVATQRGPPAVDRVHSQLAWRLCQGPAAVSVHPQGCALGEDSAIWGGAGRAGRYAQDVHICACTRERVVRQRRMAQGSLAGAQDCRACGKRIAAADRWWFARAGRACTRPGMDSEVRRACSARAGGCYDL
jgi:hypothetical protein